MKYEILIAGRGGQGILIIGRVLGIAVSKYSNLYVTCSESYVAETRGGDSRADIIISDKEEELDFIKVRRANIALFLHPAQLPKFANLLSSDTTLYIDETYLSGELSRAYPKTYKVPYSKLASDVLGNIRVANMVALGHLIATSKILRPEAVEKAIEEAIDSRWVEINKKAFRFGLSLAGTSGVNQHG